MKVLSTYSTIIRLKTFSISNMTLYIVYGDIRRDSPGLIQCLPQPVNHHIFGFPHWRTSAYISALPITQVGGF